MKLIIDNFPPITQRCEIDLSKRVILFVGKNNSGKTYLSQLIWGINRYATYYQVLEPFKFISYLEVKEYQVDINRSLLQKLSKRFTEYISNDIIKKIFKKDIECSFKILIEEQDINNISIQYFDDNIRVSKTIDSTIITVERIKYQEIEQINIDLELILLSKIFQNTLFLPSSRLFFPSFYKYIFNMEKSFKDNMFENFEKINERNKKFYAPSYTQPIDILIKKLIFELDKPNLDNRYLKILSNIIEGDISVDRAEEIAMADISYNHKSGENIPMYLSSSMVNQLSMLYLYFKYWHSSNNFLIMDEPEMNLTHQKR